jgi:hypothetical protein
MRLFSYFLVLLLVSCSSSKKARQTLQTSSSTTLKFLSEYDLPNALQYKGTTVGGLSGIDHDASKDIYYLVSDDRSSINHARFYSAAVHITGYTIDSVQFLNVQNLLQADGTVYPNSKQDPYHTPDPEALRYNPITNKFTWSSEGERILKNGNKILEDPAVMEINQEGRETDSFTLPANMHMQATENGPRQNGVFEGLTFSGDFKTLYVDVEEPIYEDGYRAGLKDSSAWTRILAFDVAMHKPIAQYGYRIDPVAHETVPPGAFKINGVPDILWLPGNQLLVIERSFSTGRQACTIHVYIAQLQNATDVSQIISLPAAQGNFTPLSKKLLLDMDSLGMYIDNIEGVCWGPVLPNGHKSLLFVSDDNFSKEQKTQILLFEWVK